MSEDNQNNNSNGSNKANYSFDVSQSEGTGLVEAIENGGFETLIKSLKDNGPLANAVKQAAGTAKNAKSAPSLAFSEAPTQNNYYLGLFKQKTRLLPDDLIKQIRITDHLVATILRSRANMMALFGKLRSDRFDIGVELIIKPEFYKILTPEQ